MKKSVFDKQTGGTHYVGCKISPAKFIHANDLGFLAGCMVKRLCRYKKKDGLKDLQKIQQEIAMLIELEYPQHEPQYERVFAEFYGEK